MKHCFLKCVILEICTGLLSLVLTGARAECLFPAYLQSERDEFGEPLPWHTNMWWLNLRNEPKLREKQDIFVQRSHIWSQQQNNKRSCDRNSRRVHHRATSFGICSERYLLFNRTCLIEEGHGKFRVIQYGPGGSPTFLCMAFERRSDSIIQVREGPARENNEKDLCDPETLHLNDWPWIAPWKRDIVHCPVSGGFSFRTVSRLTNEDFCEDEWRRSRLEIECSTGDGLNFISPKGGACNPFSSSHESSRLYCWAGWQHRYFTYLVVGDASGIPQYCLRFPREISNQFTVMVYFSVLCPTQPDGMPQTGIEYYEMRMVKVDPDHCVDDDPERCVHILKKGACTKENKFAVHCQKSCGLCEERRKMLDMPCPFSAKVHGTWIFKERYHEEKVKINHTVAHFSKLGSFVCKERSIFSDEQYKTASFFENGCAMRFTCIELRRHNNNILQFRIGKSYRTDAGFDEMCQFEDSDDLIPDLYRQKQMKNLILDGRLWDTFCGLSSTIPFNGTVYGETCFGSVTDWDEDGCVTRGNLVIRSNTCSTLSIPMEYQCLGLIAEHPLEQFIITKSRDNGEFNCWVMTSFLCDDWTWKYRAMFKLDSPQCTTLADSACILEQTPEALLYLHDEEKTKRCKGEITLPKFTTSTENSASLTPTSSDLSYVFPVTKGRGVTIFPLGQRTARPGEVLQSTGGASDNVSYTVLLYAAILLLSKQLVWSS